MARSAATTSQSERLKKMREESQAALSHLSGADPDALAKFIADGDRHPGSDTEDTLRAGAVSQSTERATRSKKSEDKIMKPFPLRLPPSMLAALKKMGEEEDRDVAEIIREAIREHLRAQYI